MDKVFKNFIDNLAKTELEEGAFNQYSYTHPANEIRRNNLLLYFLQMHERKPQVLLVGEAPGYQGCRFTGVPFGSEYIILNGIPKIGMFGTERGYKKTNEYKKIWKEPSATIVWETLANTKTLPLIWASFPYHPHNKENPLSNRAPTGQELKIGQPFILELIEIFGIKKVIAVGNKAEMTLSQLSIDAPKIRHPSHGGKNEFVAGIEKYLA